MKKYNNSNNYEKYIYIFFMEIIEYKSYNLNIKVII